MSGTQTPFSVGMSNMDAIPAKSLRRYLYVILSVTTALTGLYIMFDILRANELRALEALILFLFAISFTWLSLAFWSGVFGFILQMLQLDPLSLKSIKSLSSNRSPITTTPITTKSAVIMPVYNEDTLRVIAGFEATLRSLEKTGELEHFDFFLLSDTTNLTIAQAELNAWQQLTERLGALSSKVFYRRREKNLHRKVGNISEFCQRWGANYEHMIVLDADSIMTGDCLVKMVRAMQTMPNAGLIQTVPIPVRQTTFFGRFVQFAAVLYSPMLATGLAFWQTDAANYWGHNAIIRIRAFMEHCGLPKLPGQAPFGGEILSHDFVEAAMLRRAGWDVILLADLEGSYEEVPCNIIDYAKRDRRWVQGNIQHLGILDTKDLHPISRMHFTLGALAYVTSWIWLLMLGLSTADAIIRAINSNVYFTAAYQLYPSWPIAKNEEIIALVLLTTALLMGPKCLGALVTIVHRRKQFGGARAIIKGVIVESIFAVLIAPIMMVYHAYFVVSVLLGFKVNWDSQNREGRLLPWSESFARTSRMTITAIIWGSLTYIYAPIFFWWLIPVLTGLILAAPLVRYSSSLELGARAAAHKIFLTPSETHEDHVLAQLTQLLDEQETAQAKSPVSLAATAPSLPPDNWIDMPVRDMDEYVKKATV
jgi:membrane glycosyltransferase